jgi:two-component system OmpR family sensor kinase
MPPQLDRRFKVVHFEDSFYVYIEDIGFGFWLKDIVSTPIHWYLIGWYGVALGFLIALYLWLFKSLKPLKTLQKEILKVSNGDLSVSLKRKGDDEIAQVANEFDNALRQIELLIQSRQLFLRTIMHELKTPIAKGRLISAMLDDEQKKEQYGSIFERLELLIEEFAKIEQMLSSNYHLKLHTYNIQDVLDLAIEQLFLDEEEEIERIEIKQIAPFKINTDFNLLALALKNLLDNALKYSYDKKVLVLIEKDSISFINSGDALKADIIEYFKPFHRYISNNNGGMGLGLYIIKNSLEKLSLKLEYRYENAKHIFKIHS